MEGGHAALSVGEFNVHYKFEIWRFVSERIFVAKTDIDFWGPLCESNDFVLPTTITTNHSQRLLSV